MTRTPHFSKAATALITLVLFASGCTKTREPSLNEDAQESVFAISEFGELTVDNSPFTITGDDSLKKMSLSESSKATAEKGLVAVSAAQVPTRLKYMFKGLEITSKSNQTHAITFAVDKQFVTAYKIADSQEELSILEKQIGQSKDELTLQKELQKTSDLTKGKKLIYQLSELRAKKTTQPANAKGKVLVPLFKFKVASYGTLKRIKNELKEETSNLQLKDTDWNEATHIQISTKASDRILVGLDPASRGDLDRTYVASRLDSKLTTASVLKTEFDIPLNLKDETQVLTLLDVEALHVFEVGDLQKMELTDSQKAQLKIKKGKSNVTHCSEDIKRLLQKESQANCVMILRYDIPVSYVRPELPVLDYDGNQDAHLQFKSVRAHESVGLIQIDQNVQPRKIENNNELDPRTTIRLADIRNKEFFFKRTLQDAPVTTIFPPGMAGNLTIVRFALEENRMVIHKADKLIDFKNGSNDVDYEEIMSLPVRYSKLEERDATGAKYSIPKLVPASRLDAEYAELDWTKNTLSGEASPYETLQENCFKSIGSAEVSDVDMKLDKGVLNFSFNYTVGLSVACIADYKITNSYNGTASYQNTARLKERISFKVNDGSTDKSFAPQVPFRVQNELGYGVWTIGRIKPSAQGLHGREGQEENFSAVHDFRNGKKLIYTVTGLEPSVQLDPEIRQLYRDTATDVVNAWDLAYRNAFKGTSLERQGRYLEIQFSGDNNVSANLGDLDKNILHFENKFNDNHGILGVSQVGFNPRSGIVVADSLIIYAGNLQNFVAYSHRNQKVAQSWEDKKKLIKEKALKNSDLIAAAQAKADALANTENKGSTGNQSEELAQEAKPYAAGNSAKDKVEAATQFTKHLIKKDVSSKKQHANLQRVFSQKNNISETRKLVKQSVKIGSEKFRYSPPENESAWMDRVLRTVSKKSDLDDRELQGLIAKEMLASRGGKISAIQKAQLEKAVRAGDLRSRLRMQFKNGPSCALAQAPTSRTEFSKKSFKEALREELYFDIAHEMGHSQGLTHNFIGSFDKANFTNEDGSPTGRNYSSIMDYIEPGKFHWDGVGTYDIHALRASHLGLLETNSAAAKANLVNKKFISIQDLKATYGKDGWNNFDGKKAREVLKAYKYCTDIHVGYAPNCQRFDAGTTASEIVDNLIKDYDNNYVTNYHSWDRNDFGLASAGGAVGRSIGIMFQMRQFLDETFYLFLTGVNDERAIQDYVQASIKVYSFYNRVLRTPEANSLFQSPQRLSVVPYAYAERGKNGASTGKYLADIEVVESRALNNIAISEERLDTVGIEFDKVMALNLLTMKGFPSYKYASANMLFSFLDFERLAMRVDADRSPVMNLISDIFLNKVSPAFSNDKVLLEILPENRMTVSQAMTLYAGIYGILNLESVALRDKDNYANYFKVGSSIGSSPSDRIALSQLGVSESSKTRLNYWALDNASFANRILQEAYSKDYMIRKESEINPLLESLVLAQLNALLSRQANSPAVEKAKIALKERLTTLNSSNQMTTSSSLVDRKVEEIAALNQQVIMVAAALLSKQEEAKEAAGALIQNAAVLAESDPLFALSQKAMRSALEKEALRLEKLGTEDERAQVFSYLENYVSQLVDGTQLETSYGIVMKNISFLNQLTLMTNPEFNR